MNGRKLKTKLWAGVQKKNYNNGGVNFEHGDSGNNGGKDENLGG